jgi:hypothetical protein
LKPAILPIGHAGRDANQVVEMALVFEVYGALCFLALAVLLVWAAMAKLRPDLDEEKFEHRSRSPPLRTVKQSKRPMRSRPHLFHTRKPHAT